MIFATRVQARQEVSNTSKALSGNPGQVKVPDELNFDQVVVLMEEFLADEDNWAQIRSFDQDDPLITNNAALTMLTAVCSKLPCGGGRDAHWTLMQMSTR